MPPTTRKRKRSVGSHLSLNHTPVVTHVNEDDLVSVPVSPVVVNPNETTPPSLLPNLLSLNVQVINTREALAPHIESEVSSTVNVEPVEEGYSTLNDVTTGPCVSQSDRLEIPRADLQVDDHHSHGDSESKSLNISNNANSTGPSGDKKEALPCSADFNVDLFVESALSCGLCQMPYSTVVNRWKPLQFKPCNHLACFNCIDEFLIESSVKRVPLYKIICRLCNQKISQITCNESVSKLIEVFIDAGVVAETASPDKTDTAEFISDPSLETRKLEVLSDFKLSRKTLAQFPSASFDPPVAPPIIHPPPSLAVDTSLLPSESSSPASPTDSVAPGNDPSGDTMVDSNSVSTNPTSQSTRVTTGSGMTRNEAINVFLEHIDFLYYTFANSPSQRT